MFWHSSAHMLGEALEHLYGSLLTIGPPLTNGFYYDSYMGSTSISDADYKGIDKEVKDIAKKKQKFERLVVTKEEALELFAYNPFKHQLISTKVDAWEDMAELPHAHATCPCHMPMPMAFSMPHVNATCLWPYR